jgi:hypothetical protein
MLVSTRRKTGTYTLVPTWRKTGTYTLVPTWRKTGTYYVKINKFIFYNISYQTDDILL